MAAPTSRIEDLLRHEGYVRALARRLVFDEDLARDVVQETWLAALKNAPRDDVSPRPWLARVVRSFAHKAFRARSRRGEHEQSTPPREVPTEPAILLEREDARRSLVEAVAALDEPWRGTLILRYFDELEPAEIARRTGVPAKTVYTRLERGLELLRARLERKHGGGAWALALVKKLHLEPSSHGALAAAAAKVTLQGALVMGIVQKTLLAGAAVVAIAASLFHWKRGDVVAPPGAGSGPANSAPALTSPSDTPLELDAKPAREHAELPSEVAPTPASAAPSRTGSLLLRAIWAEDKTPASGISVKLHPYESDDFYQDALDARTGVDGSITVDPILAGRVGIFPDRGNPRDATVAPGERTEVTLELPLGFDLSGRVSDFDGRPVAGAEIYAYACHGESYEGSVLAHSNEDGSYFARSVDAGGLSFVSARARGRAPTEQKLVMSTAGTKVKLDLVFKVAGGSLEGRVLAPDGTPCSGAAVVVGDCEEHGSMRLEDGTEGRAPAAQRVYTGEDGRYLFLGVAAGETEIQARAKGFAPWKGRASVAAGHTTSFDIALQEGAKLGGIVRDETGSPVARATVTVGGGYGFASGYRRTEADGSFTFEGVPVGLIDVRAESEQHGTARAQLSGASGEALHWDAVLSRGLVLRGRVVDATRPIEGWMITVTDMGGGEPFHRLVSSGADGRFEIFECPDAPLRLEARAPNGGNFPIAMLKNVRAGSEVLIQPDPELEPSVKLRGRVLDSEGRPLAGVQVIAGRKGFNSSPIAKTELDTGTFELGPYPPGTWTVRLKLRGFADHASEWRELPAGAEWNLGDVTLRAGGQVIASVKREAGLESAKPQLVLVSAAERNEWMWPFGDTAQSSVLEPGRYRLCAGGAGIALCAQDVDVRAGEDTRVDVVLSAGVPVTVRIAESGGRPLDTPVRCRIQDERGLLSDAELLADPGPVAWSGHLLPGAYRFSAKHADGRTGELAVEVSAGEAATAERTLTIR